MVKRAIEGMGYIGTGYGYWDLTGGYTTTLTSSSPLTLPNSAGKYLKLSLTGASEQDSTTGAQLWDESVTYGATIDSVGNTAENSNYMYTGYIPLSAGRTYCVSENQTAALASVGTTTRCAIYDANKNFVKLGYEQNRKETKRYSHSFSIPENGAYIRIGFRVTDEEIMINAGANAKPFEHYTGGKPSPSPEYPQPIKSAGLRTKNICKTDFSDWELGQYAVQGGKLIADPKRLRMSDLIKLDGTELYFHAGSDDYNFVIRTYSENDTLSFIRSIGAVINGSIVEFNETEKYASVAIYRPVYESEESYEKYRQLFADGTIKPFICLASEQNKTYEPYGYKADVRIHGKNLLDPRVAGTVKELVSGGTVNGITIKPLKDGRVQVSGTPTVTTGAAYTLMYGNIISMLEDGETYAFRESIQFKKFDDNVGYATVFTVNKSTMKEIRPYLQRNISVYRDGEILYPMLIRGNSRPTTADYEPYHPPQTATIHTKEPLRGIGDCKDVICKKGGVWGMERKVVERVFDGESQISANGGYQNGIYRAVCRFAEIGSTPSIPGVCDKLRKGSGDTERFNLGYGNLYLFIDSARLNGAETTLADLKQWLSNNPLTVAAERETPTWEPLDDATQAALNALAAYKGTTIITVDSGDVPVQITATYKKKGR